MSFSIDSCVPAPVCEDKTYKMDTLDNYKHISEYLGDPETADWVGQGEPLLYKGNVLLTMPPKSSGTVLATTRYMWYGNVKARLKTSRGAGVVTAFILFSDVKDEIDYEWVGVDLNTAQTNYYFQGIPDCEHLFFLPVQLDKSLDDADAVFKDENSGNISVSETYDNFHEYEIRWTPDEIQWLIDGKLGRTKKRSETWNATTNQWEFPQTPSRVQISIWPGGREDNPEGTIKWAGGVIDWNSDEIKNYGYYFATFSEVTVECYKTNSPPGTNKGISYHYTSRVGTNDTVVDGDKPTVLKSLLGTGTDMDKTDGTTSGDSASSSGVHVIPGGGMAPPNQVPGGGTGSGGGSGDAGGASGDPSCDPSTFSQSCGASDGNGSNNRNDAVRGADRTLGASAFAVIIGIAGLLFL